MPRFVIVDDTDPSIQYSGPWFEVDNTQTNLGINGSPFNNTLHGVNVTSNFSFPFSGSTVIVYGTSITTNVSGPGTQDPTWECFIDGTSIGSSPPSASMTYGSENNWILCGGGPGQFQDGPHLLTVNAKVSNQQTFWLDQIQYAPSANVSLDQSLLRIDASDSAIQYSPGWEFKTISISYTTEIGGNTSTMYNEGNFTYEFFGTSISFYGILNIPNTPPIANASYTIDDQEPITFSPGSLSIIRFNEMLFKTGQLSPGQHKLVVEYSGNDSDVQPFQFNYLVQQDTPSSVTSPNTPTSTSVPLDSLSNSSSGKPTEAIIGGVLGGFIFILLLLALFFFRRRRPKALIHTFTASPTSSTFLSLNYTSDCQSLPSPYSISSKFTHMNQPSSPSSPRLPITGSHNYTSDGHSLPSPSYTISSKFTQPSPTSPRPRLPFTRSQTTNTTTRVPQATTEPSIQQQQSPSPLLEGANGRFLRHEDSGVRIPAAEDNIVELPPFYTPG